MSPHRRTSLRLLVMGLCLWAAGAELAQGEPRPRPRAATAGAASVERRGDYTFLVDRAALIAELGAGLPPAATAAPPGPYGIISRWARLVPELRDGRPTGAVKLMDVRGPLLRLGLEDGDLVRRVNGLGLTSPEAALRIYAAVTKGPRVTLALERGKRTMLLLYLLR